MKFKRNSRATISILKSKNTGILYLAMLIDETPYKVWKMSDLSPAGLDFINEIMKAYDLGYILTTQLPTSVDGVRQIVPYVYSIDDGEKAPDNIIKKISDKIVPPPKISDTYNPEEEGAVIKEECQITCETIAKMAEEFVPDESEVIFAHPIPIDSNADAVSVDGCSGEITENAENIVSEDVGVVCPDNTESSTEEVVRIEEGGDTEEITNHDLVNYDSANCETEKSVPIQDEADAITDNTSAEINNSDSVEPKGDNVEDAPKPLPEEPIKKEKLVTSLGSLPILPHLEPVEVITEKDFSATENLSENTIIEERQESVDVCVDETQCIPNVSVSEECDTDNSETGQIQPAPQIGKSCPNGHGAYDIGCFCPICGTKLESQEEVCSQINEEDDDDESNSDFFASFLIHK